MADKHRRAIITARKFLRYQFTDVDFNYTRLTDTERALCTVAEFENMLREFHLATLRDRAYEYEVTK